LSFLVSFFGMTKSFLHGAKIATFSETSKFCAKKKLPPLALGLRREQVV
jgi:hypothetical protein